VREEGQVRLEKKNQARLSEVPYLQFVLAICGCQLAADQPKQQEEGRFLAGILLGRWRGRET
jgi:hypothetical protein